MADLSLDETYNIREAIDFLTEKMGLREKLIQSARQIAEKDGGQKFGITVKRFEDLLADFLRLYQPVFERIAGHKEALQKDIMNQKQVLTGVLGMIQVARGVEVLADRVRELEGEAKGIEDTIKDKAKTMDRIDELLSRTRHHGTDTSRQNYESSDTEGSSEPEDYLAELTDSGRKAPARKTGGRSSS
jgi:hypothetical protein